MTTPTFDSERPSAAVLLRLAEAHLRRTILPLLPPEGRREAALILRALALAAAELAVDPGQRRALMRGLEDLGFADLEALARAIRAGQCDDDRAVEAWLRLYVAHRLPDDGAVEVD